MGLTKFNPHGTGWWEVEIPWGSPQMTYKGKQLLVSNADWSLNFGLEEKLLLTGVSKIDC